MANKNDPKLQSFLIRNKVSAPRKKIALALSEFGQAAILRGGHNAQKIEAFENDKKRRYAEWREERQENAGRLKEFEKIPHSENRALTAKEEIERADLQAYHDATAHIGPAILEERYSAILNLGLGLIAAIPEKGFIVKDAPVKIDTKNPRKVANDSVAKIKRLEGEQAEAQHGPLPIEDALAQFRAVVRKKAASGALDFAAANRWSYRKLTADDRLLGRTQTESRGTFKFRTQPVVVQNGRTIEVESMAGIICAAFEPQLMAWAESELSKLPPGESIESRKRRIAEIDAQILIQHRICAAALAECQRQGLEVDFPRGLILAPEALLGVEFVPAPAKGSKVSKAEDDFG